MVKQVRRWWPQRQMVLIVDGAFASVGLGGACVQMEMVMVSRLRWDARLHHPPGPQPKGKRGAKPQKGDRQRALKVWAAREDTPWQEEAVDWYGGQKKSMKLFSRTALWYRPGQPPLPIRFVITRDPHCLHWVRQQFWNQQFFVHSTSQGHVIQWPHELIELLGLYGFPKAA
jgi:hypothetical protein